MGKNPFFGSNTLNCWWHGNAVPLTSDTAKERTSSKCCRATAGCCTFASFTAVGGLRLGGRPSPRFPQGHVPCGAGEAVASLILALAGTSQGCTKRLPQCSFSAKRLLPSARRKELLYGCFVTVQLVLVEEHGTSCQGIPSRTTVPLASSPGAGSL